MRTRSGRRVGFGIGALLCGFLASEPAAADDPGVARSPHDRRGAHQYVGALKCKTCHKKKLIGNQYAAWLERDPHAQAYRTLESEASKAIAVERGLDTPPAQADACLRCHVTAHGVAPTLLSKPLDPADGVQCESCHGPGRDYRKKKIMSKPQVARKKGLWDAEGDASICAHCHNAESPTFDPERYTLPDGTTAGFDFEQARQRIAHPIPEDVKGHYLELEKAAKAKE